MATLEIRSGNILQDEEFSEHVRVSTLKLLGETGAQCKRSIGAFAKIGSVINSPQFQILIANSETCDGKRVSCISKSHRGTTI